MSKNTGGPAFPVHDPFAAHQPGTANLAQRLAEGMTLRDYFAAKAPMPPPGDFLRDFGMEATGEIDELGQPKKISVRPIECSADFWARWSFHYADTMLAERAK